MSLNGTKICVDESQHVDFAGLWTHYGGNLDTVDESLFGTGTILLVEDEEELCSFLSGLLVGQGYTIITAVDGQDAVDTYRENIDRIDMVLMDVMMPRKDGVVAYKEIKKLDPASKIVLMSGLSSESLGGIENLNFIHKPMLPTKLFAYIRDILGINTAAVDV